MRHFEILTGVTTSAYFPVIAAYDVPIVSERYAFGLSANLTCLGIKAGCVIPVVVSAEISRTQVAL